MKKTLIASLALLALAACAQNAPPPEPIVERGGKPYQFTASPGDIVALEIAFNRMAQDKGQWTAYRTYADKSAEMFVPERVMVHDWLKGRADPSQSVSWQVSKVMMSCDGKFAATTGSAAMPDGSPAVYTTIWAKSLDGRWRWVLDSGYAVDVARAVSDPVATRIASCSGKANAPLTAPNVGDDMKVGLSLDQSLRFISTVRPDGSRRIEVSLWNGTSFDIVIVDEVPAGG
jgi:hypothetical protein